MLSHFILRHFAAMLYAVAKCHKPTLLKVQNKTIISQLVEVSWVCDQSGNMLFKKDKSYHICIMRLKRFQ